MTSIKTILKASLAISIVAFLVHCSEPTDDDVVIDQYAIDSVIIADYINKKGYDPANLDTSDVISEYPIQNGVRRAIGPMIYMILEEGDAEMLEKDDIVSFYYSLSLTNDSVKFTNKSSLAKEYGIYDEDSPSFYNSHKFTLSPSRTTVPSLFSVFMNETFKEGVVRTMPKMKVGGHARFIIPSTIGYSNFDNGYTITASGKSKAVVIPANSVIIADIYPVFVRKTTTN